MLQTNKKEKEEDNKRVRWTKNFKKTCSK